LKLGWCRRRKTGAGRAPGRWAGGRSHCDAGGRIMGLTGRTVLRATDMSPARIGWAQSGDHGESCWACRMCLRTNFGPSEARGRSGYRPFFGPKSRLAETPPLPCARSRPAACQDARKEPRPRRFTALLERWRGARTDGTGRGRADRSIPVCALACTPRAGRGGFTSSEELSVGSGVPRPWLWPDRSPC